MLDLLKNIKNQPEKINRRGSELNVLVCYMIMDASDVMSKGTLLATITDPFRAFERKVNAPNDGYIINANLSPIVYQGMLYTT
jgi:predicted deacylase